MSADMPIQMLGWRNAKGILKTEKPFHAARPTASRVIQRIPPPMLQHLDACAKANYRTRTAEIIQRLQASMANESIDEHGVIVVRSPAPLK